MAELRLTIQAQADLEDIRSDGVARFGQDAAERHLRSIRQTFELLSRHPLAGQERPEFSGNLRSIPRRPHRILYTVRDGVVLVVRVIHQARDVAAVLADDA